MVKLGKRILKACQALRVFQLVSNLFLDLWYKIVQINKIVRDMLMLQDERSTTIK